MSGGADNSAGFPADFPEGGGSGGRGPSRDGPSRDPSRDLSRDLSKGGGSFDPGPQGFQPADPEDLRRHPARSDACRAVRQLLRDFADGELDTQRQRAVEEHLHDCRDCSLALSRAEHEVWMLRRALRPKPAALRPSPGFGARLAARAMGELTSELAQSELTREARRRDGGERTASGRSRRGAGASRRWGLALAGAMAVVLGVGGWFGMTRLWAPSGATTTERVEARAEAVVVHAENGSWSGRRRVSLGDRFQPGSMLSVGSGGRVAFDLRVAPPEDAGAPRPTGSGHRVEGELEFGASSTALRDAEGAWTLENGVVSASLDRGFELAIGGGAASSSGAVAAGVSFGPGRFLVASTPVVRHDQALDPLGSRRIRVEVLEGEATVSVTNEAPQQLRAGTAGVFVTGDGWRVEPLLGDEALAAALTRSDDADDDEVWLSQVIDEISGQPLAFATVTLWTDAGPQVRRTDAEGRFQIAGLEHWIEGSDAPIVAEVRPAAVGSADPGVQPGFMLPAPCVLLSADERAGRRVGGGPRFLTEPLVVPPSRVLFGSVRSVDQRPLSNAAVWPAVYDELLGTVEFLDEALAFTDARGGFALRGLPARTGPMQSLVALVVERGFEPRLIALDADARKGPAAALDVSLVGSKPDVSVSVDGFGDAAQSGALWQVAITVPYLGGTAALKHTVSCGSGATLAVPAMDGGGSTSWARARNARGQWSAWFAIRQGAQGWRVDDEDVLQRDLPGVLRRDRVEGGRLELSASALAAAIGIDASAGSGAVSFEWVSGLRYRHVLPRTSREDAHLISARDMTTQHVRPIDVFVEGRDQRVRFAGSFDSYSECAVSLAEGGVVFGIDPAGGVGQLTVPPGSQRAIVVPVAPLWRLELGTPPSGAQERVTLRLRGTVPDVRDALYLLRPATAEVGGRWLTGWVPPGNWTVTYPDGTSEQFMLDLTPTSPHRLR